jgi:sirohydrochlorin cobaltochelatase
MDQYVETVRQETAQRIVGHGGRGGRAMITLMNRRLPIVIAAAGMLLGCGPPRPAAGPAPATAAAPRQTAAAAPKFGVLVMAHGGSAEWNQSVLDAVAPLKKNYDIEVAFGMADADSLQDGVRKLEARAVRNIGVVRMFVSGESFLQRTEQVIGLLSGAPPAPVPPAAHAGHATHANHAAHGGHSMAFYRITSASSFALSVDGLADAEAMGTILAERAAALSTNPAKEDVLILAHGPGDDDENTRWLTKLDVRAAVVRARASFRRVQVETLREDWPDKRKLSEQRIRAFVDRAAKEGGRAIVLPFRVQGFGPYAEVLKGLPYVADGMGLIPHAEVTQWIRQQVTALQAGPFRPTCQ